MTVRAVKRFFIALMGSTLILIGVALLVLPGPGWVVIFTGFGVLATEFAFARRAIKRARRGAHRTARTVGLSPLWCQRLRLDRRYRRREA